MFLLQLLLKLFYYYGEQEAHSIVSIDNIHMASVNNNQDANDLNSACNQMT